ncbi:MAG TPA: hypothetical protein PLY61_17215 [Anaerohalosphaeraceae bacterium]|jgi:hypothetical protein|nr:hypothetical protein [Anaerohalosphaeraceae bacterium]
MKTHEKYKDYVLGAEVSDYIATLFQQGGKTLATAVMAETDLQEMRKATFLPEAIPRSAIEAYNTGGVAIRSVTEDWLARHVQRFLVEERNSVVIFEHALARRSDPWLQRPRARPIFHNDEVYFPLFSSQATDIRSISKTRNTAETWLLLGFMTSFPNLSMLVDEIDLDAIQILARNTEHIITSAYDGEGYIICSKV